MSAVHGYLLDTNIVSELVRRPGGLVATRIEEVGEDRVCTSVVVSAELRFGADKCGSAKLRRNLEVILAALDVLPLEPPADHRYAELRDHLRRNGTLIGPNDMLIAARARAVNRTAATANLAPTYGH